MPTNDAEIKVFITQRQKSQCEDCGEELGPHAWITLEGDQRSALPHMRRLRPSRVSPTRRCRTHTSGAQTFGPFRRSTLGKEGNVTLGKERNVIVDNERNIKLGTERKLTLDKDRNVTVSQERNVIVDKKLHVPLVPVKLHGLYDLKRRQQYFAPPGMVSVIFGEPITIDPRLTPTAIAEQLQRRLEAM